MTTTLAAAVLVSTMRLVASHAYAEGAPPGFSGGFKEDSCHACHFHEDVNAPPGRVTVEGVPAAYAPGQRYTLTVTLTRADMKRAGFQLTARVKDGGAQAGALAPGAADAARVAVESQGGVQYAGQSLAGAAVEGGVARWTVEWTAPAGAAGRGQRLGQRRGWQRERRRGLRLHLVGRAAGREGASAGKGALPHCRHLVTIGHPAGGCVPDETED